MEEVEGPAAPCRVWALNPQSPAKPSQTRQKLQELLKGWGGERGAGSLMQSGEDEKSKTPYKERGSGS